MDPATRSVRGPLHRLASLCRAEHADGADALSLLAEAVRIVRDLVPADGDCVLTLDPATLLHTGFRSAAITDSALLRQLLRIEYGGDDLDSYAALAQRIDPVSCGPDDAGARSRTVLHPAGYRHELRAVLHSGADTWAAFSLLRGESHPPFAPEEADLVRSVAPTLAEGVRQALLRASTEALTLGGMPSAGEPGGPGLVLLTLGAAFESDFATATAVGWLDRINDATVWGVPCSLVGAAQAALTDSREVRFPLCCTTGQWLEVTVTPLGGDRVALIIQPCHPWESARIIARAYGLSPREREVALLVLRGRSTKEIATSLALSPYTVQDHLKRIFGKTGARSRAELTGRVFLGHYLHSRPDHATAEPAHTSTRRR